VLITKLDFSDRTGWQPKWIWDWMDRKRQLGPPPPPAWPSSDLWNALNQSSGLGGVAGGGIFGGGLSGPNNALLNPPDDKKK
jgi:hypothetical protein